MNVYVLCKMKVAKKKKDEISSFVCPSCGKSYMRSPFYQRHVESHSDSMKLGKKFECSSCRKSFVRQAFYERHLDRHPELGKFPFECEKCLMAFTEKNLLVSHMKTHEGQVPRFKCELCGETFVHFGGFNRHKLLHTEKKPFRCPMCGIIFPDYKTKVRHMAKHIYFCGACNKDYDSLEAFQAHIPVLHRSKMIQKQSPVKAIKAAKPLPLGQEQPTKVIGDSKSVIEKVQCKSEDEEQMQYYETNNNISSTLNSSKLMGPSSENKAFKDKVECGISDSSFKGPFNALSCSVCKKQYLDIFTLRNHQFFHVNTGYYCSRCKLVLKDMSAYGHHLGVCSTHLFCVTCCIQFITVEDFEKHHKEHSSNELPPKDENNQRHADIEMLWNRPNNFVYSAADFMSQNSVDGSLINTNVNYWIEWLSEFLTICKTMKDPFKFDLVPKIVQVHDTLIKLCQNPIGAVKNIETLALLLRIKEEFHKLHTLYCIHLGEEFLCRQKFIVKQNYVV